MLASKRGANGHSAKAVLMGLYASGAPHRQRTLQQEMSELQRDLAEMPAGLL